MLLGFCVEICCAGHNRLYWRGAWSNGVLGILLRVGRFSRRTRGLRGFGVD